MIESKHSSNSIIDLSSECCAATIDTIKIIAFIYKFNYKKKYWIQKLK